MSCINGWIEIVKFLSDWHEGDDPALLENALEERELGGSLFTSEDRCLPYNMPGKPEGHLLLLKSAWIP